MNDSGPISRRGFIGGASLPGSAAERARAGLCRARRERRRICAVVPGRTFAFPADHGPHPEFRIEWWYVTANLKDASGAAYGAQWTLFRQAIAAGRAAGRLGQPADLDGPCRRDPRRYASLWPKPLRAAASVRPASKPSRFSPGSMPGRCAGSMRCATQCWRRSNSRRRAPISPTRCGSTPTGRWCCRATPATAGNPTADRPRIITASRIFHGDGPHHHRRQARRGHRTGLAGPGMEQPAAGVGSDRMGLVLAASERGRKTDAVPAAPERRPQHDGFGNWIAPDGNGRNSPQPTTA